MVDRFAVWAVVNATTWPVVNAATWVVFRLLICAVVMAAKSVVSTATNWAVLRPTANWTVLRLLTWAVLRPTI